MAPRTVVRVARKVSRILTEQEVPHALAGALAVGVYGFVRMTEAVHFIIPRSSRSAIGQIRPTRVTSSPLSGIMVTVDRVDVTFLFVGRPLHLRDLTSPAHHAGLPVLGLDALLALKLSTGRSKDILDVIELIKLGNVSIDKVSGRLSNEEQEQFQDLVRVAHLEKAGNPKEGRRILIRVLARSLGPP